MKLFTVIVKALVEIWWQVSADVQYCLFFPQMLLGPSLQPCILLTIDSAIATLFDVCVVIC